MRADPMDKLDFDTVENPKSGERFVFTTTTEDSGGELLAFDFFVAPGGGVPETHRHVKQSEVFRCRRGELTVTVEGETRILRPGDEVHLAPGTRHSLVNAGDTECECAVEYRPAGRNEALLKLMHGYTWRTGKDPGPLAMGPFIGDADLYGPGPVWLQKALFNGVLKPLGILFGRRRKVMAIAEQNYGRPIAW